MIPKGKDFVLWNPKTRSFGQGRGHFNSLGHAKAYLALKVAPELEQLVQELTSYFGDIGMHEVCKACFAGEKLPLVQDLRGWSGIGGRYEGQPGVGCCRPCGLQGHESCLSKPLGCATWMCSYTSARFPQAKDLMSEIHEILRANKVPVSFFTDIRPAELTREQTRGCLLAIGVLRRARRGRAA